MISESSNLPHLLDSRSALPGSVQGSVVAVCLLLLGLAWWLFASPRSLGKIFGVYSIASFFFLLVITYLLLWGILIAISRASMQSKAVNFALNTVTLLVLIGLLEAPAVFGLVDYRNVISPPESFLITQLKPWDNPANLFDRELIHIHHPGQKIVGETVGDLVRWLGIPTDRRYPVNIQYDGHGFRNDQEFKQADVVVLGDSFVEGVLVPQPQLVSSDLRQLLNVQVANLGQSGYGPQQEAIVLKRFGSELRPKVVLWFFFEGNDLLDVARYERFVKDRDDIIKKRDNWSQRTFTRNALYTIAGFTAPDIIGDGSEARRRSGTFLNKQSNQSETIYFAYPGTALSEEEMTSLPVAQTNLLEARKFSEDNGAKFLFVFVPTKFRVYSEFCEFPADGYGRSWKPNDLPARLDQWSKDNGISYLDLTPALKESAASGGLVYFSDDGHWNAQGHRVAAETIARFVESGGWLTPDKAIKPGTRKTNES